jgi:PAS domain-containing protein
MDREALRQEVREEIRAALLTAKEPDELLDRALAALKKMVPHDLAIVIQYAPDCLDAAYAAHFTPFDERWPQKWFPVEASDLRPIANAKPQERCIPDLEKWVEENFKKLREDVNIQQVLERDYVSFAIPLIQLDGPVPFQLSLLSRKKAFFDPEWLAELERHDIGLEAAITTACRLLEEERKQFPARLSAALAEVSLGNAPQAAATYSRRLAERVVTELATFSGWQNVAIFRVDRSNKKLVLLEQRAGEQPIAGFRLPDDHAETFDSKSLLAKAYHSGKPEVWTKAATSTTNLYRNARDYSPVAVQTKSAICYPIKNDRSVAWLLSVEDTRQRLFNMAQERKVLHSIRDTIQGFLGRITPVAIQEQIFQVATRGVVVTDVDSKIQRVNPRAQRLLELKSDSAGVLLSDILPNLKRHIDPIELDDFGPIEIGLSIGGIEKAMFVTCKPLLEEAAGRVYFFDDADEIRRIAEIEEFAYHIRCLENYTRPPLLQAANKIKNLQLNCDPSLLLPTLRDVLALLTAVEWKRSLLLRFLPGRNSQLQEKRNFNVARVMREVVNDFQYAESDRHVECNLPQEIYVFGNPVSIRIVFRAIFDYLRELYLADGCKMSIRFAPLKDKSAAMFRVEAAGERNFDPHQLDERRAARAEMTLGNGLLGQIIRENGGMLAIDEDRKGFDIELPLAVKSAS